MHRIVPFQTPALIISLIIGMTLAACHRYAPAPNPEPRWQIYDMAWRRGQSDRLTPLPNDWKRYQAKLAPFADVPEREAIFSTGYDDGFSQHPEEQRGVDEMAYDEGYRNGKLDAWSHKPARSTTDASDREVRQKGYADGYNGRPHQYHRPY